MIHDSYTTREIASIVQGELFGIEHNKQLINELLIDSRQLIHPAQTLFFALITHRNDGHRFIKELYDKGVRAFVISNLPADLSVFSDADFIQVSDTLIALQQLAGFHRRKFNIPVIAITGSNGKTIVKEWLFQLLNQDKNIVRSPKSYNSQIGIPLSIWNIEPKHDLGIFEAGISMPNEMAVIQNLIRPTIGIFTNIGQAHSENFINLRQKTIEKLKLFTQVQKLFYCSDHQEIVEAINECFPNKNFQSFVWGRDEKSDLQILNIEVDLNQTRIHATFRNRRLSIFIPFVDQASIENAMHCWAIMLDMAYSDAVISERMAKLSPIAMRLELKEGINNCTIINDGYNSDINSLSIALDFLNRQTQHPAKTLILSDILQSGETEHDLYEKIAKMASAKGINRIIGIGEAISRQADAFTMEKEFHRSTAAFLAIFDQNYFSNETILCKGARAFEFEHIVKRLQQKAHETVLEIDLGCMVENLNYYRSKLLPGIKIMAMVKAFGYGSGGFEVAKTLQFHHVDYLAVAYVDEGVELRKAGITIPIMVMSPEEHSLELMLNYDLEPEVFSLRILDLLLRVIAVDRKANDSTINIHIKLDTGMHRLGFMENELPVLVEKLLANPVISVKSVFSHLAASDSSLHDEFTLFQIDKFKTMSEFISEKLHANFMRHILNSAGISRFGEFGFDMVRLGIGLYGVPTTDIEKYNLQTVLSLKSTISQIKQLRENESIGYNRTAHTTKPTTIGIVPIGYADGLSRLLGNGNGKLWVNGKEAKIVGAVCMDMCMIDITDINTEEGDEVVVFDAMYPIEIISNDSKTIPYEILTRISRRVKRVYFQE